MLVIDIRHALMILSITIKVTEQNVTLDKYISKHQLGNKATMTAERVTRVLKRSPNCSLHCWKKRKHQTPYQKVQTVGG